MPALAALLMRGHDGWPWLLVKYRDALIGQRRIKEFGAAIRRAGYEPAMGPPQQIAVYGGIEVTILLSRNHDRTAGGLGEAQNLPDELELPPAQFDVIPGVEVEGAWQRHDLMGSLELFVTYLPYSRPIDTPLSRGERQRFALAAKRAGYPINQDQVEWEFNEEEPDQFIMMVWANLDPNTIDRSAGGLSEAWFGLRKPAHQRLRRLDPRQFDLPELSPARWATVIPGVPKVVIDFPSDSPFEQDLPAWVLIQLGRRVQAATGCRVTDCYSIQRWGKGDLGGVPLGVQVHASLDAGDFDRSAGGLGEGVIKSAVRYLYSKVFPKGQTIQLPTGRFTLRGPGGEAIPAQEVTVKRGVRTFNLGRTEVTVSGSRWRGAAVISAVYGDVSLVYLPPARRASLRAAIRLAFCRACEREGFTVKPATVEFNDDDDSAGKFLVVSAKVDDAELRSASGLGEAVCALLT